MSHNSTSALYDAFDTWTAAWNNGDLDGYLAGYWESEQTRYISNGKVIQGYTAIAESYKSRFGATADLGQLELTQFEVTPLSPADVLVFGVFEHRMDGRSSSGAFTVHLRNFDGEWLIVLDHSSS